MRFNFNISRKTFLKSLAIFVAVACLVGLIVGLVFAFKEGEPGSKSSLKGAIVSNGVKCASIGEQIMEDGGSAVDVAISVLFCEGVVVSQSMGIGGGFLATIYDHKSGKVHSMNAREMAPLSSTEDMFVNVTGSITGATAAAVPGEILGYWEMHDKFGVLKWELLIEPTIKLCRNGFPVSTHMRMAMVSSEKRIMDEPSMREVFVNPKTNKIWEEGDIITRPKLAETLEIIAKDGADAFYKGDLGKRFADDVKALGGHITMEDLHNYHIKWEVPTVAQLQGKYTAYSSPLPGSGSVLALILNMMNNLLTNDQNLLWHHIVESFKHGYGLRTHLGDPDFEPEAKEVFEKMLNPEFAKKLAATKVFDDKTFDDLGYYGGNFSNFEDHGTANMAVLHPSGDSITVTSTVNNYFGAKVRSQSTGIILNDQMDDFSTPGKINGFGLHPSPANFIKPGKRPLSSMCPSIVLNEKGETVLLVGGAGGSKITTAVAQIVIRYLFLNQSIVESVQTKRLHHQLAPMVIQHEFGYDESILKSLESRGHKLESGLPESGFAALTAIGTRSIDPIPVFDNRRGGSTAIIQMKNKMVH
ncbi:hypothetical protein ACFFRR_002681 [Megaselia abdita]